jgi:hypothetical protein
MASPPSKASHSRWVRLALLVLVALGALLGLPAASVSAPPAKTPVISGFNPASGPVGSAVTINGQWFQKASKVTFNGASASFTVGGNTQISATVPAGATSGPITVTTPAGSATSSAGFSVTIPPPLPTISGFNPASGPVGSAVTITGSNFTGTSSVAFNGTSAGYTVVSSSQISATVPTGASSGPITVTTPDGSATSSVSFTVINPPTITGFNPTSGPVGTTVTITGTNLTATSSVSFNGTSASYTVTSDIRLSATVPSGAPSGPITVTNPAGSTTSSGSFTVTIPPPPPTISGISPTSGAAGVTVTISGSNFTGASSVAFNGTSAGYTVVSDTQISATVPTGASSGPITVTTPGGSATSSVSFTVINPPTITGFNPTSGPVGTTVTITGTNLNGATSVTFNGTGANYTITSNTQIAATVPTGATTGPITVTTPGGTTTSSTSFTVTTATASYAVYVGYYDTHHPDNPKPKPNPWLFSPNVVFVGVNDAGNMTTLGDWDSSAVRIDNLSGAPLTLHVTVDIPVAYPGSSISNHHFDLWGTRTIAAGQSLILAQTAFENFDGSDYNSRAGQYGQDPSLCTNPNDISTGIPVVHVTVTTTTDFSDTGQILNTHGVDGAGCFPPVASPTRDDESSAWHSIS